MDYLLVNANSKDNHEKLHNLSSPDIANMENRTNDSVRAHTKNPTACLICVSSSQDEPAYCNSKGIMSQTVQQIKPIIQGNIKKGLLGSTSSFVSAHHSSNNVKPDFTYSPLLNVQHSRRKRRLQKNNDPRYTMPSMDIPK